MAHETKRSKKRVARKVTLSIYMVSKGQRREGEKVTGRDCWTG
jgi:hypothetical protein